MPNWDAIRKDYIIGRINVSKLAQTYGVSRASIYQHITKEKWTKQQKDHQQEKIVAVSKAIKDKDIKAESAAAVKAMKNAELACDKLLAAMVKQAEEVEKMPPSQLSAWSKALETAIKIARDLHNVPTLYDAERLAIAKRDLAMREEEHKKNMETGSTEPIVIKFENDIGDYAK